MIFNLLVLLCFAIKCESNLKLVFSEEFNHGDYPDLNKWDIKHEDKYCDGQFNQMSNHSN